MGHLEASVAFYIRRHRLPLLRTACASGRQTYWVHTQLYKHHCLESVLVSVLRNRLDSPGRAYAVVGNQTRSKEDAGSLTFCSLK
jgi:hypothetical protein